MRAFHAPRERDGRFAVPGGPIECAPTVRHRPRATMSDPPPAGRTLRLTLICSLPALAVLGALWVGGALGLATAAIGYGATLVGLGLVAGLLLRDVARLEGHFARLVAGGAVRPPAIATRTLVPLATAILRHVRDLSRESERLRASSARDDAVLAALPDPLLILDSARRIVRANDAALALFGADIVGRDLATALSDPRILRAVDEVCGGAEPRDVELRLASQMVDRQLAARIVGLDGGAGDGRTTIVGFHDLTLVKRSEQMRADFVANVSHELRTPLTSLSGFIETLQGPARGDDDAHQRFLAIMQEQAERMNRLVDDLLSLSEIELVEHTPPLDPVDAAEVLRMVVDGLQPQAAARRMSLEIEREGCGGRVIGDREQLAQVFRNLIDNAIKYGREASPIEVRIERRSGPAADGQADTLSISVADRGPGIAREHLPRLTERFYRVDAGRSRELGGTGLGLAIVKHIVNRHRGTLAIKSEVDRGSRFTVSLPLAVNDTEKHPPRRAPGPFGSVT